MPTEARFISRARWTYCQVEGNDGDPEDLWGPAPSKEPPASHL